MTHHYLEAARQGKNDWWRYLVSILMVISGALIVGTIAALILAGIVLALDPTTSPGANPGTRLQEFITSASPWALTANLMPHFVGSLILLVVVALLHQRSPLSLISPERKISWPRIAWGAGVWLVLLLALDGVSIAMDPASYQQAFQKINWSAWLGFLPFALLTIPVQTSAEELFFRGYLVQGLGLLTRNSLVLYIVGGLFFAAPHFANPEMARGGAQGLVWMALTYFLMGVFGVLITLRDNRLELALGQHAANNLYIVLISNSEDSVLKTPALVVSPPPDPIMGFWLLLLLMSIAYILYFVVPRWVRSTFIPVGQIQKHPGE
jgi:uncharacterized protein